ncbi:MAG: DUF1275 domain-containing protein [Akkermansiaceae bacterium]|nr:DUF1275 domain-containing protein [Akkermansiaceae bacterium]
MFQSLRRMTPEPKAGWIVFGGCCLAFLAAAVNAGFLIDLGTSVSHLTGDVSKVAMQSLGGDGWEKSGALYLAVATVGFIFGAMVSGFFVHHPTLEISRPYGRTITAIGGLLLVSHGTFTGIPWLSVFLASCACGMQNALATHYRGMVLRTTHVTGLLTDLGTNLGMRLKGHHIAAWKLGVPVMLLGAFFLGALFGTLLHLWLPGRFLLVLGVIYIAGGIAWTIRKRWDRGASGGLA